MDNGLVLLDGRDFYRISVPLENGGATILCPRCNRGIGNVAGMQTISVYCSGCGAITTVTVG